MDRRLQYLQRVLDLSDGSLLFLARETAQDADLSSVDLLTAEQAEELETTLLGMLFSLRTASAILGL